MRLAYTFLAVGAIASTTVSAWTQGGNASKYDITLYKAELVPRLFPEFNAFWQANGQRWPDNVAASIETLRQERYDRLKAQENCTALPYCLVNEVFITPSDNETLFNALKSSNASPALLHAWPYYVLGVNNILNDYGNGTTPYGGADDSVSYNVTGGTYTTFVGVIAEWALYGDASNYIPPFDAFNFAFDLLEGNDRQDAVFYEDIWQTLNAPALARARTINWDDYDYTAVISLGQGNDLYDVPLSPTGRLRVRIVADGFVKYKAPFIFVVDGAVHPKSTPYFEGVEMRKQLIEQHGVPEEFIITEPYARHTTTGMRNAARYLDHIGAPFDKPALLVCNSQCASYVASEPFLHRFSRDIGYSAGTVTTFTRFATKWIPTKDSLFVDPRDPLDP